jgi:hypothetical protein
VFIGSGEDVNAFVERLDVRGCRISLLTFWTTVVRKSPCFKTRKQLIFELKRNYDECTKRELGLLLHKSLIVPRPRDGNNQYTGRNKSNKRICAKIVSQPYESEPDDSEGSQDSSSTELTEGKCRVEAGNTVSPAPRKDIAHPQTSSMELDKEKGDVGIPTAEEGQGLVVVSEDVQEEDAQAVRAREREEFVRRLKEVHASRNTASNPERITYLWFTSYIKADGFATELSYLVPDVDDNTLRQVVVEQACACRPGFLIRIKVDTSNPDLDAMVRTIAAAKTVNLGTERKGAGLALLNHSEELRSTAVPCTHLNPTTTVRDQPFLLVGPVSSGVAVNRFEARKWILRRPAKVNEFGQTAKQSFRNIEVLGAWSPTGRYPWLVVRCWSTATVSWLSLQTELADPHLGPVGVTLPSWHGTSKTKLWYMVGPKGPLTITSKTDNKRILRYATDLGLPEPLWGSVICA